MKNNDPRFTINLNQSANQSTISNETASSRFANSRILLSIHSQNSKQGGSYSFSFSILLSIKQPRMCSYKDVANKY